MPREPLTFVVRTYWKIPRNLQKFRIIVPARRANRNNNRIRHVLCGPKI